MKRRDLLKAGAVGAVGAATMGVAGSGCATVPRSKAHTAHDAERFLMALDVQLGLADRATAVDKFVAAVHPGPRKPEVQQHIAASDDLFRKIVRALFITQSFRDLSPDVQLHTDVQERMTSHLDEIDNSMFALSDFLAAQTSEQRTKLRDTLRAKPDAVMQIGEEIDQRAAAAGMSKSRRKQLRSMMSQAAFRLKTEAPGALIDEYTAKVERLRGADGQSALAIALAQKMGQRAFWKYQQYVSQQPGPPTPSQPAPPTSGPPGTVPTQPPPPMSPDPGPPPPGYRPMLGTQPKRRRPGTGALRAGGYMLGIGVVTFGVSLALVETAEAFIVGATIGAILVSIGLVVLIIGAILYAAN